MDKTAAWVDGFPFKLVASGLRLLALLAFLMSFVSASFHGQSLTTANGWQAAFGGDLNSNVAGQAGAHMSGDGALVFVMGLMVLALAAGLLQERHVGGAVSTHNLEIGAVGLGALAALVLIFSGTPNPMFCPLNGPTGACVVASVAGISMQWEVGFYLALVAIVLASLAGAAVVWPKRLEMMMGEIKKMSEKTSTQAGATPDASSAATPNAVVIGSLSPDGSRFWDGKTWAKVE
jgi:hypothetical protein